MKNNHLASGLNLYYYIGFSIILLLPLLVFPPLFFPTDWGKTIIFRSIMSLMIFLFLFQILNKKQNLNISNLKNNKTIWILLVIFLISLLSTLFSVDVSYSLWGSPYRSGGLINFAFYILFCIFSFVLLKKSDWEKLWDLTIIIGGLISLFALIQYFGLFSDIFVPFSGRPPSTLGNPIIVGMYLLILFFITAARFINEKGKGKKMFYLFSCLLFIGVILISGSRASYLGLLAGGIFFALFYPKKILTVKVALVVGLILVSFIVFYLNTQTKFPQFLENNRIFKILQQRLSIDLFLSDPRFSAWKITSKAIQEKPVLGWGPENFAVGFDKYYDPSLPFISKDWGGWWDRPHNFLLDITATTGILSLLVYLFLLTFIFWKMQKVKKIDQENNFIALSIQSALIGYLVSNFFFFDTFATYLLMFAIFGYSMHLINKCEQKTEVIENTTDKKVRFKTAILWILGIILIIFIWQYNLVPLNINAQINIADSLIYNKNCNDAFSVMDNALKNKSFLDAFIRGQYIDQIKKCASLYPEKDLANAKRGVVLLKEALAIQPTNTRFWIFLGSFTTIEANAEQDLNAKNKLLAEARGYFEKASKLAPNHQEVIIELAKSYMVAGQFEIMKEKSIECIKKEDSLGECYLIKALSEIYLKQYDQASADMQIADDKRFDVTSTQTLHRLVSAYASMEKYKELSIVYRKLVKISPNVPEYHSSLAFTYAKLGMYDDAKEQALIFLDLMPSAKDEVDAFLKMIGK